jgi:hypothetical protein
LTHHDAVEERVESDRASRVHTDQVALDRGGIRTVVAYAANRDAVACRIDDVAGSGCAATNGDSGPFLDIDAGGGCPDCCRSGGIGAEIIALHQCRVAVVQDQSVSTVGRSYVARRG